MAISMIKMLQSLSIKVPEQVSVLGFDNINESKVITPELTTVHVKNVILLNKHLPSCPNKLKQIRILKPDKSK